MDFDLLKKRSVSATDSTPLEPSKSSKRAAKQSKLEMAGAAIEAYGYHATGTLGMGWAHFLVVGLVTALACMFVGAGIIRVAVIVGVGSATTDALLLAVSALAIYTPVAYAVLDITGGDLQWATSLALLFYAIQHKDTGVSYDDVRSGVRGRDTRKATALSVISSVGRTILMMAFQYGGYLAGAAIAAFISNASLVRDGGVFATHATLGGAIDATSAVIWRAAFGESIMVALICILLMNLRDRENAFMWPLALGLVHAFSFIFLQGLSGGPANLGLQFAAATVAAVGGQSGDASLTVTYFLGTVFGAVVGIGIGSLVLLYLRRGFKSKSDHAPI